MSDRSALRRSTQWARRHAPAPVVRLARTSVDQWGSATAGLRLLPSFVIVGAQRSGTTTLYRLLSDHPAVLRPTTAKGIGYFDLNYDRGPQWYRGHFPIRWRRSSVTFESSGYYSFHPHAIARLVHDLPQAKLVMMLRDPVDRAYSAHRHEFNRGFESEPFHRAVELESARLAGEVERMLAEPKYQSLAHRHHAYLGRGRYVEQVRRIQDLVGGDRLHLLDADRFFDQPREQFESLQRWLGLPLWQPDRVPAENAQPREPMDRGLRAELTSYFEPFDRQLEELTGMRPSWRH